MQTVPQIIDTLGGPSSLARELGLDVNVVSSWKHRGRIPARHWPSLIETARKQKLKLTLEQLFAIKPGKREVA